MWYLWSNVCVHWDRSCQRDFIAKCQKYVYAVYSARWVRFDAVSAKKTAVISVRANTFTVPLVHLFWTVLTWIFLSENFIFIFVYFSIKVNIVVEGEVKRNSVCFSNKININMLKEFWQAVENFTSEELDNAKAGKSHSMCFSCSMFAHMHH